MYPVATAAPSAVQPTSSKSSLAELFEVILDRGLVIDAYVRISLIGIELVTIDARIVVASVDTYLHFAEAVNRLDLRANSSALNIADLANMGDHMVDGAADTLTDQLKDAVPLLSADDSDD